MEKKKEKVFVGTGEEAAKRAKLLGASRATQSRIRRGRQNFFFRLYHDRVEAPVAHKIDNATLQRSYLALFRTVYDIVPDLQPEDAEDLVHDILVRVLTCRKKPKNFVAVVLWWAKRFCLEYVRRRSIIRRLRVDYEDMSGFGVIDRSDVMWPKIKRVVVRYQKICQRCGKRRELTVHHIVPRRRGGKHSFKNLAVLCRTCHLELELMIGMFEEAKGGLMKDTDYLAVFEMFLEEGLTIKKGG